MRPLFVLFLVALALTSRVWSQGMPPEVNRMRPDHLPTPFSAVEIRDASPDGLTTCHLIEMKGRPTMRSINTFLGDDADLAHFRHLSQDMEGNPVGEEQRADAKWVELQSHASFPAERATVAETTIKVPLGEFECWLYTVTRTNTTNEGERVGVSRFWFAKDLPGPPIKMIQSVNGEVIMTMVLESSVRP